MSTGVEQVLASLRGAGSEACSGEDLSARLGVSRAQIWKHVSTLRRRGYEISGEPGGGYRLVATPDRLYAAEIQEGLQTRWLGHVIHHHERIDSTNRAAFELAAAGAPAGTVVIAEEQTAGRGRLGRSFYSPAHLNLYNSIVLRPNLTTAEAPTLILASGLAVAETVCETLVESGSDPTVVEIKWPNDVLLDGLKTSGILMEMNAEATRVGFVIMGIGVNLNVERENFPEEFRAVATSLRSHLGAPVDRVAFTRRLYHVLEDVLDRHAEGGFESLRPRFESLFKMPGRRVEVSEMNGRRFSGLARGVAPDGALEIEGEDGELRRVLAGDVTLSGTGASVPDAANPDPTRSENRRP